MNLEKKLNQLKALDRFLKNKKYNFEEILNILLDKEVLFTNLNEYYELINAIDGIYIEKNIKLYTDENLKEMVLSILQSEELSINEKISELNIKSKLRKLELEQFNKNIGCKKIYYTNNLNYVETYNGKFVTYLLIEINETLGLADDDTQISYVQSFYNTLNSCSNKFDLYYFDKEISFESNINHIKEQMKMPENQNEDFQEALKSDIRKFEDFQEDVKYEKRLVLKVQEDTVEDLITTINNVGRSGGANLYISKLHHSQFKYILDELVYNYQYIQESTAGEYGYDDLNKEYIKIIQIKQFDKYQNLLYLQKLIDFDPKIEGVKKKLIVNTQKLSKEKSIRITQKSLTNLKSQHKFDKSIQGQMEQSEGFSEITEINTNLRENQKEVITKSEFKLEIRSKKLDDIEKYIKALNTSISGIAIFINQPFVIKQLIIKNIGYKNQKLTDSIEMTLSNLSTSFGYNYLQYQDEDGMILNVTKNSIVTTDIFNKTSEKPLSCGFICGISGSGKSTLIKYIITNNRLKGRKTFIVDQDNEFGELVDALDGIEIKFGSTNTVVNPFQIDLNNLELSLDERIRDQKNLITNIMSTFFEDNFTGDTKLIFDDLLNEMYEFYQDEEFIFSDVISELENKIQKSQDQEEYKIFKKSYAQLKMMLNNLVKRYPDLNKKTNVKLTSNTINFNITRCKNDPKYLNAIMLLIFRFLNSEMSKNRLYLNEYKLKREDRNNMEKQKEMEKLKRDYVISKIKKDINTNYTEETLSKLKTNNLIQFYEKNRQKILTIIDEFHNMITNDTIIVYVDKSTRESRKYEAGMFFATQAFSDVFRDDLTQMKSLWQLLPYKFLLRQEAKAVEDASRIISLTPRQKHQIVNAQKGTGLVQIGTRILPYKNIIQDEYLKIFGGGN